LPPCTIEILWSEAGYSLFTVGELLINERLFVLVRRLLILFKSLLKGIFMFNQYFGNYLLEKNLIKPEELRMVLAQQQSVKVNIRCSGD
jgi:hypothetical protein